MISAMDPGFLRVGRQPKKEAQTYYLAENCRKIKEVGPGGRRTFKILLRKSVTGIFNSCYVSKYIQSGRFDSWNHSNLLL